MSKRFTDTDKWKKPFIRGLHTPYKLLWLYILDECDHAGIWQVDIEVARLKIGEKSLKVEMAIEQFGNRIQVLDEGDKWFIYDFIEFQYGNLNPENRVHKSVIDRLENLKAWYQNKPLNSPLQGAKDKDKEKDKDIVTINPEKFIELFNSITGKEIRILDDKAKKQIVKLLKKGYTRYDIKVAIENCTKDEFHIKNPKYLTPEFITRDDKFTKYLSATSTKVELPADWFHNQHLTPEQWALLTKEQRTNKENNDTRLKM